ncbi:MAG: barstar family protein [Tannerellaceae bacterium]|jgi:RNAse (barnase) inhibitor barstar|nr:barstar family protein [Tannerellaceae bacterium]
MENIKFSNNPQLYNPDSAFVAHLSKVRGKEDLLKQLSDKLKFPDYFGFNWDALFECLRDFHWIEQQKIVLVHDDLPVLEEKDLHIYLEILIDAVKTWQDWKEGEEHSLEVIFPESGKDLKELYL